MWGVFGFLYGSSGVAQRVTHTTADIYLHLQARSLKVDAETSYTRIAETKLLSYSPQHMHHIKRCSAGHHAHPAAEMICLLAIPYLVKT